MIPAIELFGCAGGMAEGFRRAGIEFLASFDKDPDACASYTSNIGHAPIRMDVRDLLRLAKLDGVLTFKGGLDLIVADPPCTPWSRSGKRKGLEDERDEMRSTCDLIRALRPSAFLIGNVPGLEDKSNAAAVQETIGELASDGYCVLDSIVLDAADYGVPQHRIRPFWFGHRVGACLRWPEPTHGDPRRPCLRGFLQLAPWVTCRDALRDLPLAEVGGPVRMKLPSERSKKGAKAKATRLGVEKPEITPHKYGGHPPSLVDEPAGTITARQTSNGGGVLLAPDRLDWPWERPATTVTKENFIAAPGHHSGWKLRGNKNAVVLSEKARARLQGFPDSFVFVGRTKKSRSGQIGQAMPPQLAYAVARSIAEWFRRLAESSMSIAVAEARVACLAPELLTGFSDQEIFPADPDASLGECSSPPAALLISEVSR